MVIVCVGFGYGLGDCGLIICVGWLVFVIGVGFMCMIVLFLLLFLCVMVGIFFDLNDFVNMVIIVMAVLFFVVVVLF